MYISPLFTVEDDDLDLLRRFTAYMELVVTHARIDFFRRRDNKKQEISLDQLPPDEIPVCEDPLPVSEDGFDFEDDGLSNAFSKLNLLRKQLLTFIFVEGLFARETADRLGCTVDYVYLQKHRALKALRDQLMDERGG
jgi:DNA-directed RNA polymerase specialized sigma24 family protein